MIVICDLLVRHEYLVNIFGITKEIIFNSFAYRSGEKIYVKSDLD